MSVLLHIANCIYFASLAEEATEIWGGPLGKIKDFSIAKIEFLWRALKFKRGHGPPFSAAYALHYNG